jgi:hypothetical protein
MAAIDLESAALERKSKLQALRRKRDGDLEVATVVAEEAYLL